MSEQQNIIERQILSFRPWKNEKGLHHGMFLRDWQPQSGKCSIFQRIYELKEKGGLPNLPVLTGDQVHRDKIIVLRDGDLVSNKSDCAFIVNPQDLLHREFVATDALITNMKKKILCIRTADCQPVFFWSPKDHCIALAHCGWRGVYRQLAVKTIKQMENLGVKADQIQVWFGPAISAQNYEVSQELLFQFYTAFPQAITNPKDRHLDLNAITAWQLEQVGVHHINFCQECTFERADRYHSYRRDGEGAGRLLSFMYLE